MKKQIIFIIVTLALVACKGQNDPSKPKDSNVIAGVLPGKFSVSDSTQVQFSKGNLQYCASTKTWRFAVHQYDTIGMENSNISASYNGWIDLFGWGTGNTPTMISENDDDYSIFVDWGNNAIINGGNERNLWRTLTRHEWAYLFLTRENAATLFGLGSVNGVKGTILLPDDWTLPDGASFTASTTQGLVNQGNYYSNSNGNNLSDNTYKIEQWAVMESAGAVFLPAASGRLGRLLLSFLKICGNYWSSTPQDKYYAWGFGFSFDPDLLTPQTIYMGRYYGQSVRLVHSAENEMSKQNAENNADVRVVTRKMMRNDQLIILCEGKTYTVQGQEVR